MKVIILFVTFNLSRSLALTLLDIPAYEVAYIFLYLLVKVNSI